MTIEEEIAKTLHEETDEPLWSCLVIAKKHIMPLVKRAQAEALREAAKVAEDWVAADGMNGGEWMPSEWGSQAKGWLRHRANRIENEGAGA